MPLAGLISMSIGQISSGQSFHQPGTYARTRPLTWMLPFIPRASSDGERLLPLPAGAGRAAGAGLRAATDWHRARRPTLGYILTAVNHQNGRWTGAIHGLGTPQAPHEHRPERGLRTRMLAAAVCWRYCCRGERYRKRAAAGGWRTARSAARLTTAPEHVVCALYAAYDLAAAGVISTNNGWRWRMLGLSVMGMQIALARAAAGSYLRVTRDRKR